MMIDDVMSGQRIVASNTEGQDVSGGGTATLVTEPAPPRVRRLPPWQVLLHNDDLNEMAYVVATIVELAHLTRHDAVLRMIEAHTRDVTLLLSTHREHAELLEEQFHSRRLKVTIEPAR